MFLSAYDMMLMLGGERAGCGLTAVIMPAAGVGDREPPSPMLLTLAGLAGSGTGRMRGVPPRRLGDPDRLLWFSSLPAPRPLMMESMLKLLRGAARGGEAAAAAAAAAAARWWWKGELEVVLSGLERLARERWL